MTREEAIALIETGREIDEWMRPHSGIQALESVKQAGMTVWTNVAHYALTEGLLEPWEIEPFRTPRGSWEWGRDSDGRPRLAFDGDPVVLRD